MRVLLLALCAGIESLKLISVSLDPKAKCDPDQLPEGNCPTPGMEIEPPLTPEEIKQLGIDVPDDERTANEASVFKPHELEYLNKMESETSLAANESSDESSGLNKSELPEGKESHKKMGGGNYCPQICYSSWVLTYIHKMQLQSCRFNKCYGGPFVTTKYDTRIFKFERRSTANADGWAKCSLANYFFSLKITKMWQVPEGGQYSCRRCYEMRAFWGQKNNKNEFYRWTRAVEFIGTNQGWGGPNQAVWWDSIHDCNRNRKAYKWGRPHHLTKWRVKYPSQVGTCVDSTIIRNSNAVIQDWVGITRETNVPNCS